MAIYLVKRLKWELVASANMKKVDGCSGWKIEEALAIWVGQ